jgi:hypothetical protein
MNGLPKDPKKIQQRIKRYERELNKEAQSGFIRDGYGKRYLLGPLYMLSGDCDGALKSYTWFQATFPDDIGDPFQYLCWTLALFRSGDTKAAAHKLLETCFKNLYLVPHLLGIQQQRLDIWHGANWKEPDYIAYGDVALFALWDQAALAWARDVYQSTWFEEIRARYIEINRQLKQEPVGPRRKHLVEKSHKLERITIDELEIE